jgi:hypothetical protein
MLFMRTARLSAAQTAPMLGRAGCNARRGALVAAGMGCARTSSQIPRRVSRSLTLVSEKRIIDAI